MKAARAVFCKYGYEKASVEDIAKMANRAKTSIYYYFDSKTDVFLAVLTEEFDKILSQLIGLVDFSSPEKLAQTFKFCLKKRMELITGSELFRNNYYYRYNGGLSEIVSVMDRAREPFNKREKMMLCDVCLYLKHHGALSDEVSPDDFSEMFEMYLCGVEVQLFTSNEKDKVMKIYEAMLDGTARELKKLGDSNKED